MMSLARHDIAHEGSHVVGDVATSVSLNSKMSLDESLRKLLDRPSRPRALSPHQQPQRPGEQCLSRAGLSVEHIQARLEL